MKPTVYITRKLPESVVARIEEVCEVRMWEHEEQAVPRDILMEEAARAQGLLSMLTDQIDKTLMEQASGLKVISNLAVGYNNIDVVEAANRGIIVTNTPGVLTETTADLTFALLMASARRLVEASEYLRQGKWQAWSPMQLTGQDIYGATIGIIGMGRIGEAVARRARGFDMNVLYYNRNRKHNVEDMLDVTYAEMDELLHVSDYVCLLTPLTPDTKNLISARELNMMKPTAILVNTSRGGIVNEKDLYEALKNGVIWGAGLDVFEQEPISPDHPLLTLPNVVTLPHIGSASIRTRVRMAQLAAENMIRVLSGEKPLTPVH